VQREDWNAQVTAAERTHGTRPHAAPSTRSSTPRCTLPAASRHVRAMTSSRRSRFSPIRSSREPSSSTRSTRVLPFVTASSQHSLRRAPLRHASPHGFCDARRLAALRPGAIVMHPGRTTAASSSPRACSRSLAGVTRSRSPRAFSSARRCLIFLSTASRSCRIAVVADQRSSVTPGVDDEPSRGSRFSHESIFEKYALAHVALAGARNARSWRRATFSLRALLPQNSRPRERNEFPRHDSRDATCLKHTAPPQNVE